MSRQSADAVSFEPHASHNWHEIVLWILQIAAAAIRSWNASNRPRDRSRRSNRVDGDGRLVCRSDA